MSGEAFLKPGIPPPKKPHGSWSRSGTFTGLKQNYENNAGVALRDAYRSSQSRPVI
jgi:hypothetical protein